MYWPLCALPGPPQSSPARPRFSEDLNRRRTAYYLPLTGYGFTLNFRYLAERHLYTHCTGSSSVHLVWHS